MMAPVEWLIWFVGYLIACAAAWTLHEAAHYVALYPVAESVSVRITRYRPSVVSEHSASEPTFIIRLAAVAPTIVYPPIVGHVGKWYLRTHPLPDFTPTQWTMIAIPLVILMTPTIADLRACIFAQYATAPPSADDLQQPSHN